MRNFKLFAQTLTLLTGLLFFAGCQQDDIISPNSSLSDRDNSFSTYSATGDHYGLGTANELYTFSTRPSFTLLTTVQIQGLSVGEQMLAIDVRPINRALYGVSNFSKIYLIDPGSGMTKSVSRNPFIPAIDGSSIGFEFNSGTDRITLMTDKGQGLEIHPTTGLVVRTTAAPLGTVGVADFNGYTFGIDASGNVMSIDMNGNGKVVGSTGLTIVGDGGLDSNFGALAVFQASGDVHNASGIPDDPTQVAYRLYRIDLSNGQTSSLGVVTPMIGIAAK